jgi:hypothetical protein
MCEFIAVHRDRFGFAPICTTLPEHGWQIASRTFYAWGLSVEAAVGSVEVVEVVPILELVVEQFGFVDDDPVEYPVELFIVDAMGSFYLAVETRSCGFDGDVSDTSVQHVVAELGRELAAVVGLDRVNPQRQLLQEMVTELDSGLLVAFGIDT